MGWKMTVMASKKKNQFTVRLSNAEAERLAEWTRKTGQTSAFVMRASLRHLFEDIAAMPFDRQVTYVADLGVESDVAEEMGSELRSAEKAPAGKPRHQRRA